MRFLLPFLLVVFLFAAAAQGSDAEEARLNRKKRFLSQDTLSLLPDRLLRFSDHARQFTSRTLGGLMAEANKESSVLRRRFSPLESIFERESTRNTKARPSSNSQREVEGPEASEVIVDEPHKEPEEISSFNPFSIPLSFSFGIFTPWWKGPNVCIDRNEVDESEKEQNTTLFTINYEATQCVPTESTYVCTKRILNNGLKRSIVIKYQCCHGFVRRNDGNPGCREVKMDDVMTTLRSLEATKFADMIETSGLGSKMTSENFTVFAPSNDDVLDFEEDTEDNEILGAVPTAKRVKDLSYFVGGHLIDGFTNLHSAENDQVLPSLNGKTSIRINKYRPAQTTVWTANCVPVSRENNFATNGIVHITSGVLPLPRKTVGDVVTDASQFSIFDTLLKQTNLLGELKNSENSWTVFAPTDSAFKSIENSMLQRLLSGEGCVESVVRQHIVKGTVCSSAVVGHGRVRNLLGKTLTITRDENEKLKVDDANLNSTDVLGLNGVVHFIDQVLVPPEARNVIETLEKGKRDDILELMKMADMVSDFENMENITFFVPSKTSVKNIPEATMAAWKEDPQKLREVLLFHVVAPKMMSGEFIHNKEMPTLAEDQNIRLQLHEVFPGISMGAMVQCSAIVDHDNAACGAAIHVVDKVMVPPKGSIMEVLKSMEGHKTVLKLLELTDLQEKLADSSQGPYTLLAPTDEAFERFEKKSLDELLENKTRAEQILKMHVLPEALCCNGVQQAFPFRHHYVRTLEGNLLPIHRSTRQERVRFGTARAVRCDATAKNGLVHSVNKIMLPNRRPTFSVFDMDLFSIF